MAFAQHPIQNLTDWIGYGEEYPEKQMNKRRCCCSNFQPIVRNYGMRQNLQKHENQCDRDKNCSPGREKAVQEYGKNLHCQPVGNEECTEQKVLPFHHREDLRSMSAVSRAPGFAENFKVDEAKRHEAEGEASSEACENH
nr:hypothetical protein Iba_chr15fCG2830 [Ipomoea batatas]GME01641.1 hypothetical protein Iba_scaffold1678549CG0010 [Ipomoea batatas]